MGLMLDCLARKDSGILKSAGNESLLVISCCNVKIRGLDAFDFQKLLRHRRPRILLPVTFLEISSH